MKSKNKTIDKAHELIKERIAKLRDKKQNLRDKIDDKYPYDMFGIKADIVFDQKSRELDEEIALLREYDSGMYELMENIEREDHD